MAKKYAKFEEEKIRIGAKKKEKKKKKKKKAKNRQETKKLK